MILKKSPNPKATKMKAIKVAILCIAGLSVVACQTDPVYVPVYVPTETKRPATRTVKKTVKPKVERAEDFRAVEKPTTYSY